MNFSPFFFFFSFCFPLFCTVFDHSQWCFGVTLHSGIIPWCSHGMPSIKDESDIHKTGVFSLQTLLFSTVLTIMSNYLGYKMSNTHNVEINKTLCKRNLCNKGFPMYLYFLDSELCLYSYDSSLYFQVSLYYIIFTNCLVI